MDGFNPKVVSLETTPKENLLTHDPSHEVYSSLLSHFALPELPIPLGVLKKISADIYDQDFLKQINDQKTAKGEGNLQKILSSGDTWTVE